MRDHLICRSSGDGLVVAAADRCDGVDVVADCADEQCRVVRCCQNVSAKFVDVQLVNGVVAEMNCSARRLDSTRQCVDQRIRPCGILGDDADDLAAFDVEIDW